MARIGYAAANDSPGGGSAAYRSINLLATGLVIKASPGRLYGWHLSNSGAAAAFVKVYNKATAPTGSDTPALTLRLAAGASSTLDLGPGLGFSAGIGVRATIGVADNDGTAPGANEVIVNLFFA